MGGQNSLCAPLGAMAVTYDRHGELDLIVTVDDHRFQVHRRPELRPTYDYNWLNGPHQDYGFSTTLGDDQPWSSDVEDHQRRIRTFLSMIDPDTGYASEITTSDE